MSKDKSQEKTFALLEDTHFGGGVGTSSKNFQTLGYSNI